eukprot:567866-Hanusia_phi.AAC.3
MKGAEDTKESETVNVELLNKGEEDGTEEERDKSGEELARSGKSSLACDQEWTSSRPSTSTMTVSETDRQEEGAMICAAGYLTKDEFYSALKTLAISL